MKHPDYRQDAESAENDVCLIFTKKAIKLVLIDIIVKNSLKKKLIEFVNFLNFIKF